MTPAEGFADPSYAGLRELLQRNLDDGIDAGASVCVVRDGEIVVDLWGGVADVDTDAPWVKDTVVNTYSLTKTMTTLAALLLVDRGLLDLDAPVARYWPEFAANGKDGVLVRHVLGHTSGVSGWQQPVTIADICDDVLAENLLAEQAPWWEPGSASGYHATNYGHLVGGLVRRIAGRSLGEFFATEIAEVCGADYLIGTPADVDARVAPLIAPPPTGFDYGALPADSVFVKTMTNPAIPIPETSSRQWRGAQIGGVNGHGNARSVARVQSVVSHGGRAVSGVEVLRPEAVERVFDVQADGVDQVLGAALRFGLGYALPAPAIHPSIPDGRVCWWTGYGGSIVVNDLDRRMTFAYVMNKMTPQLLGAPRTEEYVAQAYAAL
ncbi:CubicO group peptidase (beta-lactamase class C family) [Rhodococcus sp. AG1013]|uniref:serine hydrolase domain-containing protein n=1 Tax=Rhodococcus sp. AG1013 TaxID=2183996 RepID=UPI000E09E1C2|nr:serine hydrolase domain-containing protein [Rhodococcus sp. AG1013]RDI35801.1 CubicO group peptidase (beta-lactamase class C family) [Rhodococcus sp. AG1013]